MSIFVPLIFRSSHHTHDIFNDDIKLSENSWGVFVVVVVNEKSATADVSSVTSQFTAEH